VLTIRKEVATPYDLCLLVACFPSIPHSSAMTTIIPRLDDPSTRIYAWELNENSTRYDSSRAWPTSDGLRIKFSVLATINAIVAAASLLLIVSILRKAEIRRNSFNLYLLFIAIPDFIGSFSCFLTCAMSAPKAEYYSEAMCGYQASYLTFAFTSNAWLNAVIMYQVHKLLRFSHNRRRYFPPTKKQVFRNTAVVYSFAFILGMLAGFTPNIPGIPMESHAYYGYACFPMDGDESLTWFFYFVFCPLTLLIPFNYTLGVMFHIYWYKLLPAEGRRRNIALFLGRVVAVYFLAWFPFLVIILIGNFVTINPWVNFTKSSISHLQALFTTVVCYHTNDELKASMRAIIWCDRCSQENPEPDGTSTLFFGIQENPEADSPPTTRVFSMSSSRRAHSSWGWRKASTNGASNHILSKSSSSNTTSESNRENCVVPMSILHETAEEEDHDISKRVSNDMETGEQEDDDRVYSA
jgi:hypothetical protein